LAITFELQTLEGQSNSKDLYYNLVFFKRKKQNIAPCGWGLWLDDIIQKTLRLPQL